MQENTSLLEEFNKKQGNVSIRNNGRTILPVSLVFSVCPPLCRGLDPLM